MPGDWMAVIGVMIGIALGGEASGRRIGFSEEEGVRFGRPFIGSRGFTGTLDESWMAAEMQQTCRCGTPFARTDLIHSGQSLPDKLDLHRIPYRTGTGLERCMYRSAWSARLQARADFR